MVEQLNRYIDEHFDQLVRDTQELVSVESTLDESTAGPGSSFWHRYTESSFPRSEKGQRYGI